MAGETYTRRYPGGYVNRPDVSTPVDAAALNNVDAALLRLLGEDPLADEVGVWVPASNRFVFQKIANANVDAAAAIDYSKLNVPAGAITRSKLAGISLGTSLPGSPVSGEQTILVDSLTAPTYSWLLQYDSGISDAYKWVCVGGSPLTLYGSGYANTTSLTYVEVSTMASITFPRAGSYYVESTMRVGTNDATAGRRLYSRLLADGGNVSEQLFVSSKSTSNDAADGLVVSSGRPTVAASSTLALHHRTDGAWTMYSYPIFMRILPVRVS